jgi:hypothetical protein
MQHNNKWNVANKLYVLYWCYGGLITSVLMKVLEYYSIFKSMLSYSMWTVLSVFNIKLGSGLIHNWNTDKWAMEYYH